MIDDSQLELFQRATKEFIQSNSIVKDNKVTYPKKEFSEIKDSVIILRDEENILEIYVVSSWRKKLLKIKFVHLFHKFNNNDNWQLKES